MCFGIVEKIILSIFDVLYVISINLIKSTFNVLYFAYIKVNMFPTIAHLTVKKYT